MVQKTALRINIITSKVKQGYNKNNVHCIELRRTINDYELIKDIIRAGFNEEPIIIIPTFTDKIKSISSMLDAGIMYMEDGRYYFYE